ncbi:hypothetical protein ACH4E7_31940 [Kitasatospora sp. NPDC018058]|uniref:hypothetical protein n=1 Tax=Kitasatospora sp. NPDC018058 TaxID=3364025 RepID=UPI0037C11E29
MSDTVFPADLRELQHRWYTAVADRTADATEEHAQARMARIDGKPLAADPAQLRRIGPPEVP